MPEQFTGKVEFRNSLNQLVLTVDPDSGFVQFKYQIPSTGFPIMRLTNTGSLHLWGDGNDHGARLDGSIASLFLGGGGKFGKAHLLNGAREDVILLDATNAAIHVGRSGNEGDVIVRDGSGRDVFQVDGGNAAVYVGANGNEGDLIVRDGLGADVFHVNGASAAVYVGVDGNAGNLVVRDGAGAGVFSVDGTNAAVYVGANGNEGDLIVRDSAGADVFHVDGANAAVYVGANGNEGDLIVRNSAGVETIRLDGGSGDINFLNADCAEEFDIASADVPAGAVMVLQGDHELCMSATPYDKRVVGVVSGAGAYRPGIVLDKKQTGRPRRAVTLMGKVFCLVDADQGPIEVGDLLTTSEVAGHAMKAGDPARAFGAVIGKALRPLRTGRGLVPILAALQ